MTVSTWFDPCFAFLLWGEAFRAGADAGLGVCLFPVLDELLPPDCLAEAPDFIVDVQKLPRVATVKSKKLMSWVPSQFA
jgi:hypothetical protein